MPEVTSTKDLEGQAELVERLIASAINPRDRAFIGLLSRTGVHISEAIQIKVSWWFTGWATFRKAGSNEGLC